MKKIAAAVLLSSVIGMAPAFAGKTPAPDGAAVYFVNLQSGEVVTSPVTVIFGLENMGVAPAGTEKDKTGHHHLLVNRPPLGEGEDGALEFDDPLPADEHHVHFGGGQTQTTIELEPGTHTLQLVLGDHSHIPHDPPIVSDVITITVE